MPEDVVPRPEIRKTLVEALSTGSVLLYGPRRVGKSTLLERLVAHPPHGHAVMRVDLEGHLERPAVGLAEEVRNQLRKTGRIPTPDTGVHIEKVAAVGISLSVDRPPPPVNADPWSQLRDDLCEAVAAAPDTTLVLALDEVPWWLDAIVDQEGAAAGRASLASLRRLRQDRNLLDRMKMVLTGSIGLAGFASELSASAELNDLVTVVMPPMTPAQGATLFEAEVTAAGRRCAADAARYATQLAGGSPYWIKRLAATAKGPVDRSAVEASAEALLAPAMRKQFADEGREHFRRRHPKLMPALLAMLEAVSSDDAGMPKQAALNAGVAAQPELSPSTVRECLYLLLDGFYLREGPSDTLEWVNPLFRRWWLKYGGP